MATTVASHEKKEKRKLFDGLIQVKVLGVDGEMKTIDLCKTEEELMKMTVLQLRNKVVEKFPGGADLQMKCEGQNLEDGKLLSSYGIKHLSVIQLVVRLSGGVTVSQRATETTVILPKCFY